MKRCLLNFTARIESVISVVGVAQVLFIVLDLLGVFLFPRKGIGKYGNDPENHLNKAKRISKVKAKAEFVTHRVGRVFLDDECVGWPESAVARVRF